MKADTACLTLLQLRDPEHGKAGGSGHGGKTLLVANAHLHWDPRRPDIKAVQVESHALNPPASALPSTPIPQPCTLAVRTSRPSRSHQALNPAASALPSTLIPQPCTLVVRTSRPSKSHSCVGARDPRPPALIIIAPALTIVALALTTIL